MKAYHVFDIFAVISENASNVSLKSLVIFDFGQKIVPDQERILLITLPTEEALSFFLPEKAGDFIS